MMILFVCQANLNRSPRAAEVFREIADQKGLSVDVRSAGTNAILEGENPQLLNEAFGVDHATQLTSEMVEKADVIIALDMYVKQNIETKYPFITNEIVSLGIPDKYSKQEDNLDVLYKILKEKLEPLVEEVFLSQRKRSSKETL